MGAARDDAARMARHYDRHDLYDRQLGGRLVTFDGGIVREVVRGASARHFLEL